MLCSIGEDASLAHFECGYPELLTVCNDIDTWGCRYFSLFGESPPRSRYEYAIRIGHTGPPIKPNEPFKTKARMAQSPRRGPIRGVAIQIHTTEEDDVQFTLARVNAAIRSWGCVDQGKRDEVEHFDCGSWAIDTHAFDLDLNKTVYVEAGLPGAFSCSQ